MVSGNFKTVACTLGFPAAPVKIQQYTSRQIPPEGGQWGFGGDWNSIWEHLVVRAAGSFIIFGSTP